MLFHCFSSLSLSLPPACTVRRLRVTRVLMLGAFPPLHRRCALYTRADRYSQRDSRYSMKPVDEICTPSKLPQFRSSHGFSFHLQGLKSLSYRRGLRFSGSNEIVISGYRDDAGYPRIVSPFRAEGFTGECTRARVLRVALGDARTGNLWW